MRVLLATLYLLTSTASASAEEPKGFLDRPWGTPKVNMVKDASWCQFRADEEWRNTLVCTHHVGDINTQLSLSFRPADTLTGYSMTFESAEFKKMREVVIEKFGPPTSRRIVEYTTRAGGRIPAEQLTWRWPSGTIAVLSDAPFSHAIFSVSTKALLDAEVQEQEEKTQERKKGF